MSVGVSIAAHTAPVSHGPPASRRGHGAMVVTVATDVRRRLAAVRQGLPAARRTVFSCRTYLTTFVLGGAAIEGGVWEEVATEVWSRNFFSGMS